MIWVVLALLALGVVLVMARPLWRAPLTQPAERVTVLALVGGLPVFALGVYLYLGNPTMPSFPLEPRLSGPLDKLPAPAIIAKLEQTLMANPDDTEGWRLLARIRTRQNAPSLAAEAWGNLLYLAPDDSEAVLGLAAARIETEGGVISADSQSLIEQAFALAPDNRLALYYRGLLAQQMGDQPAAREFWRKSRTAGSDDPAWTGFVDAKLSGLTAPAAR
ncbi:MAG: tetratricopeptide repeat protein [Parvibaculales bacterium]